MIVNNVIAGMIDENIQEAWDAEQVRFIHEAATDAQKKELFAKVRSGDVRVLFGSTPENGCRYKRTRQVNRCPQLRLPLVSLGCRTDFADIQNKKECGGNRQWQNHYLRNWAANMSGKGFN